MQVNLLTWEAGEQKSREYFSVKVDPASAVLRNPFQGKSSRKFQLSTIFNGSTTMTKMNIIDVFINEGGNCTMDKWAVVLSFGCGQTKNIALDR
jgi:sacsin